MIDIPYDEAVAKIAADSGKSAAEIEQLVAGKLEELSGLISKDGAVHIIANELGVQLVAMQPQGQEMKIKELSPAVRGATVKGRVAQKWEIKEFDKNGRQGKVANLLLGDETGVIKVVFWNDQVDVFEELKQDDILVITNPFVKQGWQDRLELQLNDQSQLAVNPEGVDVPKYEAPQRAEREQKYIKDLAGGEQNVEIVATIVQLYDPRFYDACPECRRKLAENLCPTHGEVQKDLNFNVSAFLDDGTGNIRTSFWKAQALQLTGKTEQDFAKYRDDPTSFEDVKNDLLGEIIKVVGVVKKNENFDRLELNANLVFTDVDPAQEIKNLEKKLGQQQLAKQESSAVSVEKKPAPVPVGKPQITEDVISLDDLEEMGK